MTTADDTIPPVEPNRIAEGYFAADDIARRSHAGNNPQFGIPPDLTEGEVDSLALHKLQIHVPERRPSASDVKPEVDDEGEPTEPAEPPVEGVAYVPNARDMRIWLEDADVQAEYEASAELLQGEPPTPTTTTKAPSTTTTKPTTTSTGSSTSSSS